MKGMMISDKKTDVIDKEEGGQKTAKSLEKNMTSSEMFFVKFHHRSWHLISCYDIKKYRLPKHLYSQLGAPDYWKFRQDVKNAKLIGAK